MLLGVFALGLAWSAVQGAIAALVLFSRFHDRQIGDFEERHKLAAKAG